MKRLLSLIFCSLLLASGLLACDVNISSSGPATPTPASSVTSAASATSTPTPQPTSTGATLTTELNQVITAYYTAIEAKNYAHAYTYLDPHATNSMTNTVFTQNSFIQLAQEMDKNEGPVVSFTIGIFPPQTSVTMTIMRSQLGPYHAQLEMKQEENTWKITALDRI